MGHTQAMYSDTHILTHNDTHLLTHIPSHILTHILHILHILHTHYTNTSHYTHTPHTCYTHTAHTLHPIQPLQPHTRWYSATVHDNNLRWIKRGVIELGCWYVNDNSPLTVQTKKVVVYCHGSSGNQKAGKA